MARKVDPGRQGPETTSIRSRVTRRRVRDAVTGDVGLVDERTTCARASLDTQNAEASSAELFSESLGSCYATALNAVLDGACLPWRSLDIVVEVLLTVIAGAQRFDAVIVNPTIAGGDSAAIAAYRHAASEARDRCVIGRAIRGNVAYKVGEVAVIDCVPRSGGHTKEGGFT